MVGFQYFAKKLETVGSSVNFYFLQNMMSLLLLFIICFSFSSLSALFVGGKTAVGLKSSEVQKAASFAFKNSIIAGVSSLLQTRYHSFEVVEGRTQVVAGINYFLKLRVDDSKGKCVGVHEVTVYDRFGLLSVTSNKQSECDQ